MDGRVGRFSSDADHVPERGGNRSESVGGRRDDGPRRRLGAAELERQPVPSVTSTDVGRMPADQLRSGVRLEQKFRLAVEQRQFLAPDAEQPALLRTQYKLVS